METKLYYLQAIKQNEAPYWWTRDGDWETLGMLAQSYLEEEAQSLNLFEAKEVIAKDKRDDPGWVYLLIETTAMRVID